MPHTVAEVVDRARSAMDGLSALGEEVADESQYVSDLDATWSERLAAIATGRGSELVSPAAHAAIEHAADEVALIVDPHRAIDWLSTFPQIVLFVLDEPA